MKFMSERGDTDEKSAIIPPFPHPSIAGAHKCVSIGQKSFRVKHWAVDEVPSKTAGQTLTTKSCFRWDGKNDHT